MAAIDTSGSLTDELLSEISAELGRMAADYRVLVVECDVLIHRVYPYKPIDKVVGRGGTDLRPPLEPDFLKRHKPDVVVYFTDGFGLAHEKPPRIPVIWCLTPDGQRPANWGRVVQMAPAQDE